jgi:hypothetical protein
MYSSLDEFYFRLAGFDVFGLIKWNYIKHFFFVFFFYSCLNLDSLLIMEAVPLGPTGVSCLCTKLRASACIVFKQKQGNEICGSDLYLLLYTKLKMFSESIASHGPFLLVKPLSA